MELDHTAVAVSDVAHAVEWYRSTCSAEVIYQDATWAFLKIGQGKLALVVPSQHPPHIAMRVSDEELSTHSTASGEVVAVHRDGTRGIYIKDPDGNLVELICYPARE